MHVPELSSEMGTRTMSSGLLMRMTFTRGLLLSAVYLVLMVLLPVIIDYPNGLDLDWNEWGEWLTGSLAPLALLWAALGFHIQSRQLEIQSSEIEQQRKIMTEQLQLAQTQLKNQSSMMQQTERALAVGRFEYATTLIPKYEAHLDVLAMYYVEQIDFESHGSGWPNITDKEPNYYIKKLTDEVESCLNFSKTEEKQEKIRKMEADKHFQEFIKEFESFKQTVDSERAEFLLSKDLRRLQFCLALFFSRSRVRKRRDTSTAVSPR
jgi:hypothetical protein